MIDILLTAGEFMDRRFEYQDEGRWSELHNGQAVYLPPEDDRYGKVVMNVTKYLAGYFQQQRNGYACFHTGIQVSEKPDTVYFPAICIFIGGKLFGESDHEIANRIPQIVIEVLHSSTKLKQFPQRVDRYVQHGIATVLGLDLFQERFRYHHQSSQELEYQPSGFLTFPEYLPGFKLSQQDVFLVQHE